MFRSPRQAIAYMAAFEKGPQLAKQDLHRIARASSRRNSTEAFMTSLTISTFLYGPKPDCLGIRRGGELDRAIREWAMSGENSARYYTKPVAQAVGALTEHLRGHGMKVDPPLVERRRQPEGATEWVLVEWFDTELQRVVKKGWEKVSKDAETGH